MRLEGLSEPIVCVVMFHAGAWPYLYSRLRLFCDALDKKQEPCRRMVRDLQTLMVYYGHSVRDYHTSQPVQCVDEK